MMYITYHFAKCTLQFSILFCNFVKKQEKAYIYIVNISIYICLVLIFLLSLYRKHKGKSISNIVPESFTKYI